MGSGKFSRRLRRGTIESTAIFLIAQVGAALAQEPSDGTETSGAAVLDRFVENVSSLSADFTQDIWGADKQLVETAMGKMSLQRPDRFYWHYETPIETIVVADGKDLWMYDVELAQVSVTPLADMSGANPALLLSGERDLREDFAVDQSYRLDGEDWVKLTPKQSGTDFSSVLIGFDAGLPSHLELVDGLDQTTRIAFSNVVVNPQLDASLFEFDPPAGTDVIGTR